MLVAPKRIFILCTDPSTKPVYSANSLDKQRGEAVFIDQ